jgi:hypothetical protein
MKKSLINNVLIFSIVSILVAGCNPSTKTKESKGTTPDGKVATIQVEVFDAVKIKNQIVETIGKIPGEKEVVTMLNESGASYIMDLTIPAEQAEKLLTKTDQSFGLGLYAFDLLYASVYHRGDKAAEISGVTGDIIDKLGLKGELASSKDYVGRIKANVDNKDSLDMLVTEDLNHYHQQLAAGEHPDVYALSVIGSNVEALYVLSQTTLLAKNNVKLLQVMNMQSGRVQLIFSLLEMMSGDENVKPYYEQFKPVVAFFGENMKISEKELAQIAPLMETIRGNILK